MDSLKEISEKQRDLKKKLKVSFVGEPGNAVFQTRTLRLVFGLNSYFPFIRTYHSKFHRIKNKSVLPSLMEVSTMRHNVIFLMFSGLDMGGLTKEWFQLLIRKIFDPENRMFVYHPHSR